MGPWFELMVGEGFAEAVAAVVLVDLMMQGIVEQVMISEDFVAVVKE